MPPADLSSPEWTVLQGQAVWRANRHAPEIAGEILVATNTAAHTLVQFTKTPFPFVVARSTPDTWQIEVPTKNRRYSRHGQPPDRIFWFQLLRAISGAPLSKNFTWKNATLGSEQGWRLENNSTGESLEGFFQSTP